jgi:hypothetical protein
LAALALLSPTAARSAPLLILEQDCCGTAARPWTMADHLAYIDTLPFDGISLNIPFTWGGLNPGPTYGYAAIMSQLAPVAGKLTKVNKNFVKVAVRRCADVFDDWSGRLCFQHWKDLADAARDSGMVGIMFDNEEYDAGSQVWNYPADVKYGATRTLAQYREQARSRGKQVMWTLQAEWPAVRVVHFHGPYSSDARVPGAPCANDGRDTSDLRGYFFAGMLEAAGSSARVVDGGECYNLRSASDFQQSWNWRKNTFPTLAGNPVVPSSLSAAWPTKISIGFGAFDQPWAGFAMDQATLQRTLTNALLRADPDGVVWLYTESHDYLSPANPVPAWLAAVANARKAAGAGVG